MSSSAPNLSFIRDPTHSGFFTQTSGSSDLRFISDPSTSGFFISNDSSPTPAPSSIPPPVSEGETTHPFLIRTTKSGLRRKIFKDHLGLYNAYFPNPADEAEWLRTCTRILKSLPRDLSPMEIISVKLSCSYEELKARINSQVPERENRFESIALRGRPSVEKVRLGGVVVVWELTGTEKGFTAMDEGNCGVVLGLIGKRGFRDSMVALYEDI